MMLTSVLVKLPSYMRKLLERRLGVLLKAVRSVTYEQA